MCNCHSILECCVMFSVVKLSIRSFIIYLLNIKRASLVNIWANSMKFGLLRGHLSSDDSEKAFYKLLS